MSTAQDDMNDKLRNHGLPVPKEADTAEPMSAEKRAREIARAVLCKGDEQIVRRLVPRQIRQAEQAARLDEREKALAEASAKARTFFDWCRPIGEHANMALAQEFAEECADAIDALKAKA